MLLQAHLREQRLGDIVVAAPVGGALGIGELVQVLSASVGRQPRRFGIDRGGIVGNQVAVPAANSICAIFSGLVPRGITA
jgi:hypothetical protein